MGGIGRTAQALSLAAMLLVAGCGRQTEDDDLDLPEDLKLPDSAEISTDDVDDSDPLSVALERPDEVIDVDPAEYRDYLAQQTVVDQAPVLLEAKPVDVKYESGAKKREFSVKLFENRPPEFDGDFKEWHENGQLWKQGKYEKGKRVGEWKYYSEGGRVVKSGAYADGRPSGEWTYFRPTGTRQRVESYKDGTKDGKWTEYDQSGRVPILQVSFRNGQRHGPAIRWYPIPAGQSGPPQKQREIDYVAGHQHGTAKEWYDNGQTKTMIEFRNGKRHGRAAQWDEEGTLVTEFQFRDGERID